MARIYIGRSTGIGSFERHVVLKMILPEKANDYTAVQMFLDEARLAASLNHQNVAQVFEVGEDGGIHFLAMEYVHGQDLRALLAKAGSEGTRVPLELALTVVAGAAAGLNHAHERRSSDGTPMGIVHRDVSPSNIMIGYDGAVKLLDFGIAKATLRSVETQSGIIKGKFAYMAPEQCRGRDVDRRSDVFSLGIILYEVTTQHRCFRADSDFDTMHRIVTGDIVRPTRLVQGYPQALEAIVMNALALDVNERYQSAGHLLEAIESFAVASRMSLSTMSLGRFMRDMFGDVQEPWLIPGRIPHHTQTPPPKEQTISSTSGGGVPQRPSSLPSPALASTHEEAPLHLPIDPPHGAPYGHEGVSRTDDPASWSAQGYPNLPPLYATIATPPPEGRMSSPNLPPMAPQLPSSVARPGLAGGSQAMSPQQFSAQSGSGSGPAHGALPLAAQASLRQQQGYPGGQSESSYPHYQPPPGTGEDIDLQPSRSLLYLGLGVALVGIIVVLVISIIGGSGEDLPPLRRPTAAMTPENTPDGGMFRDDPDPEVVHNPGTAGAPRPEAGKPEAGKPEAAKPDATSLANGPDAGAETASDESINIHVVTVPPGADVLLAGKVIGTTPLETKIKRGTGFGTLTVHRARFEDVTATIDLSGDYRRDLTLMAIPDEPVARPSGQRDPKPAGGRERPANPDRPPVHDVPHEPRPRPPTVAPVPPAKKCQAPDKINPFDTSCGGEPCPPCK
jgi:serine/threonine protein kinase